MWISLPNLLTLLRIAAIPFVALLMAFEGAAWAWAALVLFLLACATDWFDGWLARQLDAVSPFGRFLDPIADKLLIAAVLLMMVATERITGWAIAAALIILSRELLVSGLREYLAEIQVPLPVSRLAKWKTGIQMAALSVLFLAKHPPLLGEIGEVGLWVAALLTLVTGWDYLRRGLKYMAPSEE
jgi:cardiolipin synthase